MGRSGWILHSVIGGMIVAAVLSAAVVVTAAAQPAALPPPLWNAAKQGKFITALCQDNHGRIWVGTEDDGLWCDDPAAAPDKRWTHFTVQSTGGTSEAVTFGAVLSYATPTQYAMGDNHVYALACDKLGRIWVGHLNHGVSVFDGNSWENYDAITGPLGGRVFDIAVCPFDDDIWIATDVGLTRYSLNNNTWSYYTQADSGGGLPSDQIQTIAFGKDGTIYAATQCDGLAICKPIRKVEPESPNRPATLIYKHWRVVASHYEDRPPIAPAGAGLPTTLLNDVLVAKDGTVWLATDEGLAWSRDRGFTWRYIRGKDWRAKAEGLYHPPSKAQIDAAAKEVNPELLLSEDYVTCLAEDNQGYIWIGHWRKGFDVLDPKTGNVFHSNTASILAARHAKRHDSTKTPTSSDTHHYVFSILSIPDHAPILGFYGGGLVQLPKRFSPPILHYRKPSSNINHMSHASFLPTPANPPTVQQFQSMAKLVQRLKQPLPKVWAAYLCDDWMTKGDWFGRYGRAYAILCAAGSPLDHDIGFGEGAYKIRERIGPHSAKDDAIRRWIQWPKTTQKRTLYDPIIGYRRQSSWDDHGEAYPYSYQGPDVWIAFQVPTGVFRVTLYFVNKDGHTANAKLRDFPVEMKPYVGNLDIALHAPVLARARVHNFWGGVYKVFAVHGPGRYWVHIAKNGSLDTIVSAIMLDKLSGPKTPVEKMKVPLAWTAGIGYKPPNYTVDRDAWTNAKAANLLWNKILKVYPERNWPNFIHEYKIKAYRAIAVGGSPLTWTRNWRWHIGLWTMRDRASFRDHMTKFWKAIVSQNPAIGKLHL